MFPAFEPDMFSPSPEEDFPIEFNSELSSRASTCGACSIPLPRARRYTYFDDSPPPLPLTRANLRRLQRSIRNTRYPSPSRLFNKLDSRTKLELFGIVYERVPIPFILQKHIENLQKPRDIPLPKNAREVPKFVPHTRAMSEEDGTCTLEDLLLLKPAREGGMWGIERASGLYLSSYFLPLGTGYAAEHLCLDAPQPDHCLGYRPSTTVTQAMEAPFTAREESFLNKFTLATELYFPFLTAQWKSPARGETHHHAIPQDARDGSAIVNYLHQYHTVARPSRTPSLLETCHFSLTIDMRSVILWVHWREQDEDKNITFHMEEVESGMLNKERDVNEIRTILQNLQDYALGDRLEGIKSLFPAFQDRMVRAEREENNNTVTSMSPDSWFNLETEFEVEPLSPSIHKLDQPRKRKRV